MTPEQKAKEKAVLEAKRDEVRALANGQRSMFQPELGVEVDKLEWLREGPTLTEVLSALGYTHRPSKEGSFTSTRVIERDGKTVFEGRAREVWAWLRESKQIPEQGAAHG